MRFLFQKCVVSLRGLKVRLFCSPQWRKQKLRNFAPTTLGMYICMRDQGNMQLRNVRFTVRKSPVIQFVYISKVSKSVVACHPGKRLKCRFVRKWGELPTAATHLITACRIHVEILGQMSEMEIRSKTGWVANGWLKWRFVEMEIRSKRRRVVDGCFKDESVHCMDV